MELTKVFTQEELRHAGAVYRLSRISDNASFDLDERFQACKFMLEKAVADTNLE